MTALPSFVELLSSLGLSTEHDSKPDDVRIARPEGSSEQQPRTARSSISSTSSTRSLHHRSPSSPSLRHHRSSHSLLNNSSDSPVSPNSATSGQLPVVSFPHRSRSSRSGSPVRARISRYAPYNTDSSLFARRNSLPNNEAGNRSRRPSVASASPDSTDQVPPVPAIPTQTKLKSPPILTLSMPDSSTDIPGSAPISSLLRKRSPGSSPSSPTSPFHSLRGRRSPNTPTSPLPPLALPVLSTYTIRPTASAATVASTSQPTRSQSPWSAFAAEGPRPLVVQQTSF